ncbi:MAG TPA: NUDIX hydrolase [Pseudolysinimonas sp.]|nr:NUDIX hydrolase [Pseudolysinimonas sp.]
MDLDALRTGPLADVRDPAEVLEAATVFEGRVFDVARETARFGAGRIAREFTVHHGAVAVLAVDDDDRVLLINQYRHPVRTRLWEIPAGLLDVAGEDPLTAAKRELAEETDLVAERWSDPLRFYTSPGQSDEQVTLFEARGLRPAPGLHPRTDEEAEIVVRWVTRAEAREAAFAGRIGNAILLIALLAADVRDRDVRG